MRRFSWTARYIVSLAVLAAIVAFGLSKASAVEDWLKLRNYNPPSAIAALAGQDTMNSYTRRLFYINHPQLVNGVSTFRQDCPENENTIVLGCYHPGLNGIYIYSVQDSDLAGITQVTAAHEVLHAVYERLSPKDKNALDAMLQDYYKNGLTDQRVLDEVKLYQQTEPNSVYDEMSCTFGTEITSLPPNLEAYYARFFTNRQAIVAFEQNYQAAFTSRINQINADNQTLADLKTRINSLQASLSSQLNQINSDRARLDGLRSSGQTGAYNSQVASFNAEVDAYNSGVDQLQALIARYNAIIASDNNIVAQLKILDTAIDTRLTTQSPQ